MQKIVALGFFIVFVIPTIIGFVLAHNIDMVTGIIGGFLVFASIVFIGYRHMMKEYQKGDHRQNKNDKGGDNV